MISRPLVILLAFIAAGMRAAQGAWPETVGLAALGVPISDEEQEAFVHAWNVVGAMLGLREELMPRDAADAAALSARIRERQWEESEEGREMTAALLEMLEESLPGRLIQALKRAARRLQKP